VALLSLWAEALVEQSWLDVERVAAAALERKTLDRQAIAAILA
jgi:hypothetical protein